MKIKVLSAVLITLIFSVSCSDGNDKQKGDTTMYDETRPTGENHLEDLLEIKDEAELKTKFGKVHISYDTIWGAEGTYTMGSYIDKGTNDEVQIYWDDSLHRSDMVKASVNAKLNENGEYNYFSKWSSASGIKLGLTTDKLQVLNGKPFTFSGFGWDYGGGVTNWNGGKLDDLEIGVELTEGDINKKITEQEYEQILGDQEIRSDNQVVIKVQPRVYKFSVFDFYKKGDIKYND